MSFRRGEVSSARCMDGERAVGAGVPDHFHLSNHHRHYRINVVWSFSRPLPPGSSYNLSPQLTITVPSILTTYMTLHTIPPTPPSPGRSGIPKHRRERAGRNFYRAHHFSH